MSEKSPARLYYKNNRIKQLRAFCFTAQAGSISRAAERLFLSQPSVSLQIQALEREMGITVFERRGPRITLTPDGKTLYELALPLVEGIDALPAQFAARSQSTESGRLDVAAGESSTLYLIPDLLRDFMDRYPESPVKLHNLIGADMLAALRNNEVDFAIGSMLDLPDDINYRPVYSFATSLITPLDHPLAAKSDITLEDLASDALILPPRHLTTWRLVNLVLQQQNIPYQVRLEVGGWEIMKAYVERGFGIGIASNICLTGREQLAVRPLPEVFPRRTYGVMWRRGKFLSQTARRFIELMDPNFFTAGQDQRFDINHEPSGNQVFVAASGAPSRRETSVAEDTAPLDTPAKPG
ncbi:DNA-binding transcriptional LysR family regulator [Natronocella acetinitrilica]|uniref:DNA-binding transcriptional LysR family regulator n=1 Tax=Natronocella acetinitrilica TaxID=414046 RepID=A0AAE3KH90_9GAMM|nr:DNA-binding transcriptional LysR family regulator [Natronocella acetinitrilica]